MFKRAVCSDNGVVRPAGGESAHVSRQVPGLAPTAYRVLDTSYAVVHAADGIRRRQGGMGYLCLADMVHNMHHVRQTDT
jgi:hypothetical protein